MNKSSLKENVDALLAIMQSQNYSERTILEYKRVFNRFINYCNSSNIEEIDEMTAIEYVNKITGNNYPNVKFYIRVKLTWLVLLQMLQWSDVSRQNM